MYLDILVCKAKTKKEKAAFANDDKCKHCGRGKHTPETCWDLHPELRPAGKGGAKAKPKAKPKTKARAAK